MTTVVVAEWDRRSRALQASMENLLTMLQVLLQEQDR